MLVRAKQTGFYGLSLMGVGKEFEISNPQEFSFVWMETTREEDLKLVKEWCDANPKIRRYLKKFPEHMMDRKITAPTVAVGKKATKKKRARRKKVTYRAKTSEEFYTAPKETAFDKVVEVKEVEDDGILRVSDQSPL